MTIAHGAEQGVEARVVDVVVESKLITPLCESLAGGHDGGIVADCFEHLDHDLLRRQQLHLAIEKELARAVHIGAMTIGEVIESDVQE